MNRRQIAFRVRRELWRTKWPRSHSTLVTMLLITALCTMWFWPISLILIIIAIALGFEEPKLKILPKSAKEHPLQYSLRCPHCGRPTKVKIKYAYCPVHGRVIKFE